MMTTCICIGDFRSVEPTQNRSEEAAEMAEFTKHEGHPTLPELYQQEPGNQYLNKISEDNNYHILTYPRPELHVSHLSHSTGLTGLQGIQEDGGFRGPGADQDPGLVWFSLMPTPADLSAAEGRSMTLVRPGGEEEVWNGDVTPGLLQSFATSPAFSSSSRYGAYRLTFDLSEVLDRYREQFCGGQPPVLRKPKTVLYKQEVMYVVLVHSPDKKKYSDFPLLEESENCICAFRADPNPHFIWRSQAMCGTHKFFLETDEGRLSIRDFTPSQYYVWDNVSLALDVGNKVLRFTEEGRRRGLRFCKKDPVAERKYNRDEIIQRFPSFEEANATVQKLWPDSVPLQKFEESDFHIYK